MPQPRPRSAFPTAAALAANGLSVDQVDADYLNFLQHVRPDGNSYVVELPARGVSPPVTVKNKPETPATNGEAQIALVPSPAPAGRGRRVEQEIPPADDRQLYETKTMDEDYRTFWRQTRIVDGQPVLQVGEDTVLRYGLDAVPVRLSDIADWAEKHGWIKKLAAVAAFGEDDKGVGVGEKVKVAPMLESRVRDSPLRRQKKIAYVVPVQNTKQGKEEKGGGNCGAEKINVVNIEDNMLSVVPMETLNTMSVNIETNLSIYGHDSEPHIASGCYGVVWPTHIMERPESSFKEKLLRDLRRPCCPEEYKMLLGQATDRLPATKGRQLRRCVKYYNSEHETNRSYFDSHPDLAKQVRSTSYPNQLALLRGFFFWLKNITNDDQFRPWSDDFRLYSIIPRE